MKQTNISKKCDKYMYYLISYTLHYDRIGHSI